MHAPHLWQEGAKNMKKEKFGNLCVYLEDDEVVVSVSKVKIYQNGSPNVSIKRHFVREQPFKYTCRCPGTLMLGESADCPVQKFELHKGEKVVVKWNGHIEISESHKAKSGRVMIYGTHTLNLFLKDYLLK